MAFAIIANGQPVEIHLGQPFTSAQFKITTEEEAAWSFSPIGSVIDHPVSHPANALDLYQQADLDKFGIHAFVVPAAPDGKRLASYALSLQGDSVVATGTFADPEVPQEVLRVQGRLQLIAEGLLVAVDAAVTAADATTKEYWASTAVFRRQNPILTAMWAQLGRSPAQLDATFIAAAQIPV